MKRLAITLGLAAACFLALSGAAAAQSVEEPFHVFLVTWRGETDVEHGFRAHMRSRSIRVRYTWRDIARDRSRISEIVEEIRATQPDIVHTFGTSATLGILGPLEGAEPGAHVEGIPGVFSIVAYPLQARIVESFESTGRSVTGTAFLAPVATQLEAIRAYRDFERLGVIYNPLEKNSVINVEELREAAEARGIELLEAPAHMNDAGKPDPTRLSELIDDLAAVASSSCTWGPTPLSP